MEKDDFAFASSFIGLEGAEGDPARIASSTTQTTRTGVTTTAHARGERPSRAQAGASTHTSDPRRQSARLTGHESGTRRVAVARASAAAMQPDMFGVLSGMGTNRRDEKANADVLSSMLGHASGHGTAANSSGRGGRKEDEAERALAEATHPPLRLRRRLEPVTEVALGASDPHATRASPSSVIASGKLPELHAWYRVPRQLQLRVMCVSTGASGADDIPNAAQPPETGFVWQRHDALLEDELLLHSIARDAGARETAGKGVSSDVLTQLALTAVAGAGLVPFGRPVRGLDTHSPHCAFFTFTEDEFNEVMRTTTQSSSPSSSSSAPVPQWSFTFDDTCKLFRLYELFGSFPVVADRWASYDSTVNPASHSTRTHESNGMGRAGSLKRSRDARHLSFFTNSLDDTQVSRPHSPPPSAPAPSVELLCEQYARVYAGVLEHRHARLAHLLVGEPSEATSDQPSLQSQGEAAGRSHAAKTRGNTSGTPALLQFFEKLPMWSQRMHGPKTAASSSLPEGARDEASEEPYFVGLAELYRQNRRPTAVLDALSTPTPWYTAHAEQARRAALTELLIAEAAVNVPLQRAVTAYLDLLTRAAQQMERLRQQLVGLPRRPGSHTAREDDAGDVSPVVRPTAEGKASACPDDFLCIPLSAEWLRIPWRDVPPGVDPATLHVVKRTVEAHNRAHTLDDDVAITKGVAEEAREPCEDDIDTDEASSRQKKKAGPKSRSSNVSNRVEVSPSGGSHARTGGRGGGVPRGTAIASVLEEAVIGVPWDCARLVSAVRAGWMLPPPRPLAQSTGPLEGVHASAVVNRATSVVGESILLTYAPAVPRLYREVEQELEKHLLEDHRALMVDSPVVVAATEETRCLYAQNVLLRRLVQRVEAALEGVEKVNGEGRTA